MSLCSTPLKLSVSTKNLFMDLCQSSEKLWLIYFLQAATQSSESFNSENSYLFSNTRSMVLLNFLRIPFSFKYSKTILFVSALLESGRPVFMEFFDRTDS